MNITDLNECLSELPEISVMEHYRPRSPARGPFNWEVWEISSVEAVRTLEPRRPAA